MSNRSKRAKTAEQTLRIIEAERYEHDDAGMIDIGRQVRSAISGTVHYAPEDFDNVLPQRETNVPKATRDDSTKFIVKNATTLAAARELLAESDAPVLCLNFASAKNAGGGFLGGSQAQEESLARASALYACIEPIREYYETNRKCGTSLYTHHMIYSPDVPVFRDDDDELLAKPYHVSIITAPAVNRGAIAKNEAERLDEVEPTMRERIDHVLGVAAQKKYRRLVLGAWGCGVFRNDPRQVSGWFAEHLHGEKYQNEFDSVVFAVLDHTALLDVITPFEQQFLGSAI